MNTSEMLHKAADLIEERGWIKGLNGWPEERDTATPLCIEGGIMAAQGLNFSSLPRYSEFLCCPAYKAVMAFLGERRLGIGNRLCQWNDTRARNAAEVIEVLRAAAAVEELREAEARGPLKTGPTVRVPTQPGVGVA